MSYLGFVNIIKPTGMTSSEVVIKIKKILGTKKVGHLGTLDPAASGVLPVAVGRATKFFDYFLSKNKCYTALVQFGRETDTLDSFGTLIQENDLVVTSEMIESVLPKFTGDILQVPPKYSAIKVGGKKAYDLARDGVEFELTPRKIKIFSLKLKKDMGKNKFLFECHCSAGTYIRTLFSDIAKALGTVSTTEAIIRTKSGKFGMETAVTLEEFENDKKIISPLELFSESKVIKVSGALSKKVENGVKVSLTELGLDAGFSGEFFIETENGLVGFYEAADGNCNIVAFLLERN